MLNFKKNNYSNGDTLIEVLIAITVFSSVAVGSLSVMNQGASVSQRALEITLVRQEIDAQAETLRFLNASYLAAYQSVASASNLTGPALEWKKINDQAVQTASTFGLNLNSCPDPTSITSNRFSDGSRVRSSFILNTKSASLVTMPPAIFSAASTFSQVKYSGNSVTSADGIWIEAIHSTVSADPNQTNAGYLDFNIRACWDSPGQDTPVTLGTIIRLYEPIGNYTSALVYHPIAPPAPPTAPNVSVSVLGSTATWSWPASSCASGVTPDYRYRYTINYGYNSGWVATNNISVSFSIPNQGYTQMVEVQARCFEDASSPWSASGSATYLVPVLSPAGIAITIRRDTTTPSNLIWTKATSSCTGGAWLMSRADMGLTPNYYWFITGQSGWYGVSGAWYYDTFGYFGNSIETGASMSIYVPSGKIFWMRAYMKCSNPSTGASSATIYGQNTSLYTP